ncbi:glycosyltransferase [Microlunatus soli]|uniref:4,4'-diaponeurosporenoate glycosyltransferase n=1 Tax=Microlunatus soli TaxID=630515 RepID=A0A1H1SP52_9ACTN|nr:glycosyltransferase [Microlunatus soli]SDS49745.1 Glycosyl transferase family 2 [Microlunatus soli]
MTGSVIIAAHDEERVIGRTLAALDEAMQAGLQVIVVPNGCADRTAATARAHKNVEVVEIGVASKTAALREGERRAGPGPRIYLDADITLTSKAAADVIGTLCRGVLAGRPAHVFDTTGASWLVRRWYRVREQLPSISSTLWGAGCYALSEAGRARFRDFPEIVSDDLFIDSQFRHDEIAIIDTDPVVVKTPRRSADLLRILRRTYRSQAEVAQGGVGLSDGQRSQLTDLGMMIRKSPWRAFDAAVYAAVIIYARLSARTSHPSERWERDLSSRVG